jgi:hypothetical protein
MKNKNVEPQRDAPREAAGVSWQFKLLAGVLALGFLAMAARMLGLV